MKDDTVYLRHILECIRRIEENTASGWQSFIDFHTLQDAVLRNLQTLTESTQRLSDELKTSHTEIEWQQISAFRNVIVHNYLGIDLERIWEVVQHDIPPLKRAISSMLQGIEVEPSGTGATEADSPGSVYEEFIGKWQGDFERPPQGEFEKCEEL